MILKYIFDRVVALIGLLFLANCCYPGKIEDAGWPCVLCTEESGKGWQVV